VKSTCIWFTIPDSKDRQGTRVFEDKMRTVAWIASAASSWFSLASAVTIAEINGNKFLSPLAGQTVTNVTGLVTANSTSGFYLRST
jgi:hypothetical protein